MTFLPALKVNELAACARPPPLWIRPFKVCQPKHGWHRAGPPIAARNCRFTSLLSFPPQTLFILVVLVFFRMEILRSIGVACSGPTGMGRGRRRGTSPSSDAAARRPCVLYFQMEFDHKWSKATAGLHNSKVLDAHARDERRPPTIDHIH